MKPLLQMRHVINDPFELEDALAACQALPMCFMAYAESSRPGGMADTLVSLWAYDPESPPPRGTQIVWRADD